MTISWTDFEKVDLRVGRITAVDEFPKARNPSYKITVDFGTEFGSRKSCAQATNYSRDALLGRQVICVVNFPPKQIADTISEVLILGVRTEAEGIALLAPDKEAILGTKVY